MAYTTPPTWSVGEDITATDLQILSDDITYLSDLIASASTNTVSTSETTTSTSYTNLATTGPSVTLTTRTKVLVIMTATLSNSAANDTRMSVDVSGATTTAASDGNALRYVGTTTARMSVAALLTVTAGSNVFTAKYKVSAGTGTYANRDIIVVPL